MKKIAPLLMIACVLYHACVNPAKKKVFDFNQKLAGISQGLNQRGTDLGNELKVAMTSHDFTKTAKICNELKSYIDEKISDVKATENVGGSENLKSTMLDFLEFEKVMVAEGFEPFSRMDKDTPDEDIQAAVRNMMEKTAGENDYLVKVQKEQRQFAAQNGLKLKE